MSTGLGMVLKVFYLRLGWSVAHRQQEQQLAHTDLSNH